MQYKWQITYYKDNDDSDDDDHDDDDDDDDFFPSVEWHLWKEAVHTACAF